MIYALALAGLAFAPDVSMMLNEDISFYAYIARWGKQYTVEERSAREATFEWAKKVIQSTPQNPTAARLGTLGAVYPSQAPPRPRSCRSSSRTTALTRRARRHGS